MAKRKTKITETEEELDEQERAAAAAVGVTAEEEEPEDDLSRVLSELGESSNAVVKVERLREGKSPEFVDDFTAEGFSLKVLQKTYGGGEYKLTGRAQGRFIFRRTVSIAQPLNAPEPTGPARTDALADALKQGFEQQTKLLMQMMLLSRGGEGGGTSRASVLEELRTMKDIFGTAPASGVTPDKMIELVKLGVDLAGEGGEQNLLGVLTKALDTFGEPLKEAIKQQQHGGAAARPAAIVPIKTEHPMKKHVVMLIEQARLNSDPGLWAELIYERMPEAQLRAFLQGDPVMKLAEIDRRVLDNVDWFQSLGVELRELLEESALDASTTDPTKPTQEKNTDQGHPGPDS